MTELRQLTGARGIAAWAVVLYHLRLSIAGLPAPAVAALGKGYLAVDFFFLLSGFVIWLAWHERLRPALPSRLQAAFSLASRAREGAFSLPSRAREGSTEGTPPAQREGSTEGPFPALRAGRACGDPALLAEACCTHLAVAPRDAEPRGRACGAAVVARAG